MTISVEKLEEIKNSREESLVLSGQVLDDEDVIRIATILKKNPFIKKVDFSYNNIGNAGAVAIAEVETLEELDFHNGLSGYDDYENHIGPSGIKSLASSTLKKLNLSGNPVGNDGIVYLANNSTIVELIVDDCEISSKGIKEFFKINTTTKKASFRVNNIGDDGLSTIHLNHTIEELDLSLCGISDLGAQFIAANDSLIHLQLNENKIQNTGALALAKHKKLSNLDVGGCEIGDIGAQGLAENKTFLYLNLHGNLLSAATTDDLAGYYFNSHDLVFTRTPEFIAQLKLQKKRSNTAISSRDTSPITSSPLITPSYTSSLQSAHQNDPHETAIAIATDPRYVGIFNNFSEEQLELFFNDFHDAVKPPPSKIRASGSVLPPIPM